jgi:hypothetical protein
MRWNWNLANVESRMSEEHEEEVPPEAFHDSTYLAFSSESVMGGLTNIKEATNMCQSRQQPMTATTFEVIIGFI